jgi:hypothetical protein
VLSIRVLPLPARIQSNLTGGELNAGFSIPASKAEGPITALEADYLVFIVSCSFGWKAVRTLGVHDNGRAERFNPTEQAGFVPALANRSMISIVAKLSTGIAGVIRAQVPVAAQMHTVQSGGRTALLEFSRNCVLTGL